MDDRVSQKMKSWRWIGWLVSLAALAFVVRWLLGVDRNAWRSLLHVDWWWLVLSAVCFQLWFIWRYQAWEYISRRHGYEAARHQNLRMWTLSELMRYIPGNVWSFAGRFQGARQGGVETKSSIHALVVEAGGLFSGAVVMTLITLPRWWWLAPIVAIIVVLIGPWGIRQIFRLIKHEAVVISRREAAWLLVQYTGIWFVFGLAHVGLFHALQATIGPTTTWSAMSVSVFSWLVGYVTLITPMGLGVREAVFSKSLEAASRMSFTTASLVAVMSRLWMVLSELIFLLLVLGWSALQSRKLATPLPS